MTIDVAVDLFHSGTWNDITGDVDMRQAITINYGTADEHGAPTPTKLKLRLNNHDHTYSPKDPRSTLFGKIGINTPIRVRVGAHQRVLSLPGIRYRGYAETPDVAALDITGDIDIRMECTPIDDWRPAADTRRLMAGKYDAATDQRCWGLRYRPDGLLELAWSTDGSSGTRVVQRSTIGVPQGTKAVRVTLDVDNGASGHTVTFYTSTSIGGAWTQLGATVVTAGTTSIFSGSSPLTIGAFEGGNIEFQGDLVYRGTISAFELRNGIGGTVVADPDFTADFESGLTTGTDGAGRAWELSELAIIADPSIRCTVGVTSWMPQWDETTLDATCTVEGSGLLEQLNSSDEALKSSLYRDLHLRDEVVAYYPLEDGQGATRLASGKPNDGTTLAPIGVVNLSSYDGFAASENIPTIGDGFIHGNLPTYAGAADQRIAWLMHVPDAGLAGDRVVMLVTSTGSIAFWDVVVNSSGGFKVRGFDQQAVLVFESAFTGPAANGKKLFVSLWLSQDGSDVDWQLSWFEVGATFGSVISGTQTGKTFGTFNYTLVGTGIGVNDTAFGHIAVFNDDVHSIWDLVLNSLDGWAGETAAERFVRLTIEEGVRSSTEGNINSSETLGPQRVSQFLTLLNEAAQADGGFLGERREEMRLHYRPRSTLYNQTPRLELDMTEGRVINPFEPPLDVQGIANDVTVSRTGGSSIRLTQTDGPLSVASPIDDPPGIGRRKYSTELNLETDERLIQRASWLLFSGTQDQHRIASLEIELEFNEDLIPSVLKLMQGDIVRLSNPPEGLPPESVDLMVLGWAETIDVHTWHLVANLAPGDLWTVGTINDDDFRVDTAGSSTAAAFTSGTSTSMSVATTKGNLWTTDAGDHPFLIDVAGVILEVTNVTGTTSPQTFTVTQAPVNGVAKVIASGTAVNVAQPLHVAL